MQGTAGRSRRWIVLRSLLREGGGYASLVDHVVDSALWLDVGLCHSGYAEPRGCTGNACGSACHLLTLNPIHDFVIGAGSARESVATCKPKPALRLSYFRRKVFRGERGMAEQAAEKVQDAYASRTEGRSADQK
jgi:hypothetical protein